VINNVLEISELDAGKLELAPTVFGLRESLADSFKALAQRAANKGLELLYEEDEGVPEHIVGDPDRLRQILLHLTGTAIRFTEAGEVHVRIEVDEVSENRVTLHFSVRDTGTGIPDEVQANVYGAVAPGDGSPRRFGGVGLGLAISAQLVELMGGAPRRRGRGRRPQPIFLQRGFRARGRRGLG
jgi:signal transduction histidine kinase